MKVALVIVLLLFVALVGKCSVSFYQMVDKFPEEAQIENLQSRYRNLIVDLDKAIELSDSTFSLAANLEEIDYPDDVLSVSMDDGSDNPLTIINQFKPRNTNSANSSLKTVFNGGGYGHKNGQYFWILQHPLDKYEYDHIEILFKRELPENLEKTSME